MIRKLLSIIITISMVLSLLPAGIAAQPAFRICRSLKLVLSGAFSRGAKRSSRRQRRIDKAQDSLRALSLRLF
jgi:hypothetical protein